MRMDDGGIVVRSDTELGPEWDGGPHSTSVIDPVFTDAALAILARPIEPPPASAPSWLHEFDQFRRRLNDDIADMLAEGGISVTVRLWRHRDENRLLPMPLHYARPHPLGATAAMALQAWLDGRGAR